MKGVVPRLVSTVIPVHNRPDMVQRAVNSVLAQSYRPIEIIVVDDGSTDETASVVLQMAAEHPREVFPVLTARAGPGLAREAGRGQARGEFIQYLDSDDELLPAKFALQVRALDAAPSAGIAYGPTAYGADSARTDLLPAWKRTGEILETLFPALLADRWWGTSTPLYRRSVTDAAGPWLDMKVNEDWEYDARMGALGVRLVPVPGVVSREYHHEGNRASGGPWLDAARLRDRARATELVYGHAIRAGCGTETPEMKCFAQGAFLLARQCGAAGLPAESRALYILAGRAAPVQLGRARKYRAFGLAARVLGWRVTGLLAVRVRG